MLHESQPIVTKINSMEEHQIPLTAIKQQKGPQAQLKLF
jgi:hypothetical protein